MQPHQQRVVDERNELHGRLERLEAFLDTDTYRGLPLEERTDLFQQRKVMEDLEIILERRIARFKVEV